MMHRGAAGLVSAGGALKEGIQGGIERLQTLSHVRQRLARTSSSALLQPACSVACDKLFTVHPARLVLAGAAANVLLPADRGANDASAVVLHRAARRGAPSSSCSSAFSAGSSASSLLTQAPLALRPRSRQALFPAKFAIPFTIGSGCNMGAVAALRGYHAQAAHMLSKERLPFSTVYVGSMLATLWSAIVAHSYVLCMLASMVRRAPADAPSLLCDPADACGASTKRHRLRPAAPPLRRCKSSRSSTTCSHTSPG